ncbi:MAG: hypothetical protein RR035_07475 [Oscillibacter sp.]
MKRAVFFCATLTALCILSACKGQVPIEPPPAETIPAETTITAEEGAAILEALLGAVDETTGNPMSYGYENTLVVEGEAYYNYRVSWLVEHSHVSYLTNYLVSTDGAIVKEYSPRPDDTDAALEIAADSVLSLMRDGDFDALAGWVDGETGVTFTPYSTVDFDADRRLTAEELADLGEDETVYPWGAYDGSGLPIELTGREYWDRFVWDADYTAAPNVSVRRVHQAGNAAENVDTAYPCRPGEADSYSYVEYHFDGLEPSYGGVDWRAVKLVFIQRENAWRLAGIIHSEMTV